MFVRLVTAISGAITLVLCLAILFGFERATRLDAQMTAHWYGALLLYAGVLIAPGLLYSAKRTWGFGMRLFSVANAVLWSGFSLEIAYLLHTFSVGALACFGVALMSAPVAFGHGWRD